MSCPTIRPARAFTLIEVLLGILILAIGLLGLGAVIPVVVKRQQLASDAVGGAMAASAAEAYLDARRDVNRLLAPNWVNQATDWQGWGCWLEDNNWSTKNDAYLWEPWADPLEIDTTTGEFQLKAPAGLPNTEAVMSVGDRLMPQRSASAVDPKFIWDVVGRRMRTALGAPKQMQLVMFVRRIDPNIRVPAGLTLTAVLTGKDALGNNINGSDRRLPLAVDLKGYPTRNGVGTYAVPLTLKATFIGNDRGTLVLVAPPQVELALAQQIGQRLVDNLGNVYTVLGVPPTDPESVLIDPPVPSWVPDPNAPFANADLQLDQVVFTPQVPAAVHVFVRTPQNPKK